jgi:hypothetical protein
MINYPIESSDNKLTYTYGVSSSHDNKYLILQLQDLENNKEIRVSLSREEAHDLYERIENFLY